MKVSSALTFCQLSADEGQLSADILSTRCWCRSARFWQNVNLVLINDQPSSDKMSTWCWQKVSSVLIYNQLSSDILSTSVLIDDPYEKFSKFFQNFFLLIILLDNFFLMVWIIFLTIIFIIFIESVIFYYDNFLLDNFF